MQIGAVGGDAAKYGAMQNMLASVLPAYYGAAAHTQTAHLDPWSRVAAAQAQGDAARQIAELQQGGKTGRMTSLMDFLKGYMPQMTMPQFGGFTTNYGAGATLPA